MGRAENGNENEWVSLENYPALISADLAKSKLQLNGIEAEIFDGIHANMMWLHTNAIGGIKLKVRRKDLLRAREILAEVRDIDENIVTEEEEIRAGDIYCSMCHSRDIEAKTIRHPKSASWIRKWFIGRFGYDRLMRCRRCGQKWKG